MNTRSLMVPAAVAKPLGCVSVPQVAWVHWEGATTAFEASGDRDAKSLLKGIRLGVKGLRKRLRQA